MTPVRTLRWTSMVVALLPRGSQHRLDQASSFDARHEAAVAVPKGTSGDRARAGPDGSVHDEGQERPSSPARALRELSNARARGRAWEAGRTAKRRAVDRARRRLEDGRAREPSLSRHGTSGLGYRRREGGTRGDRDA